MTKPKMTVTDMDGIPRCPHCGADVFEATVTIEGLVSHWPVGYNIHVNSDGYAHPDSDLTANCQGCHKPFAIGMSFEPDIRIKLVAARTAKDKEYMEDR